MDCAKSREAIFAAQFGGCHQGLFNVIDGQLIKQVAEESRCLQGLSMNELCVASNLNFEPFCVLRVLSCMIGFGIGDNASFASALYRSRFFLCASLTIPVNDTSFCIR